MQSEASWVSRTAKKLCKVSAKSMFSLTFAISAQASKCGLNESSINCRKADSISVCPGVSLIEFSTPLASWLLSGENILYSYVKSYTRVYHKIRARRVTH